MNLRHPQNHKAAMTLTEVVVVIAVVLILAVLLLPEYSIKPKAYGINCAVNLKQITLAYRLWGIDHNDTYPMGIAVTNGGSMEMVTTGEVVHTFQVMSNELHNTKLLICPADTQHHWADSFGELAKSNISYFVGVEVTNDADPQMILTGDANLEIAGTPVKSGLVTLGTNIGVAWSAARYHCFGNLGLADDSV
jgi:competence protein ComGC